MRAIPFVPVLAFSETYDALRSSRVHRLVTRDLVTVEGPGAFEWLQGQVSQDLTGLAPGGAREALVLSPQGKLDAYCRVWRRSEELFHLEVEQGFGDLLTERLRRFKVRVKATLGQSTSQLLECRGPEALASVGSGVAWEWAGFSGWDMLLEDDPLPEALPPEGDRLAFEVARIEAGVPRMGAELTAKTIPQEAGDELLARSVSFTKGCYTGQELVARIDARGSNVARLLRGVVSAGPLCAGTGLSAGGGAVGTVTSAAESPRGGFVGLAMVRRGVELPAEVKVEGTDEEAEIRSLPLARG